MIGDVSLLCFILCVGPLRAYMALEATRCKTLALLLGWMCKWVGLGRGGSWGGGCMECRPLCFPLRKCCAAFFSQKACTFLILSVGCRVKCCCFVLFIGLRCWCFPPTVSSDLIRLSTKSADGFCYVNDRARCHGRRRGLATVAAMVAT